MSGTPSHSSSGYSAQLTAGVPCFNGESNVFKMWIYRFYSHLKNRRNQEYKVVEYAKALAGGAEDLTKPKDYDEKNKELFYSVIEAVDNASAEIIITAAEEDGVKALKVLEAHYMGSMDTQKISCLTKLLDISLEEDESLTTYGAKLVDLKKRLTQMKVTIDEDIFTILGLKGLPEKYDLFVQVVRRRKPWATFEEFIVMLKEED